MIKREREKERKREREKERKREREKERKREREKESINGIPIYNQQASSLEDGTNWKCLKVIQLSHGSILRELSDWCYYSLSYKVASTVLWDSFSLVEMFCNLVKSKFLIKILKNLKKGKNKLFNYFEHIFDYRCRGFTNCCFTILSVLFRKGKTPQVLSKFVNIFGDFMGL
jgi:hypothetical protein